LFEFQLKKLCCIPLCCSFFVCSCDFLQPDLVSRSSSLFLLSDLTWTWCLSVRIKASFLGFSFCILFFGQVSTVRFALLVEFRRQYFYFPSTFGSAPRSASPAFISRSDSSLGLNQDRCWVEIPLVFWTKISRSAGALLGVSRLSFWSGVPLRP
jgi:hypothetical protein